MNSKELFETAMAEIQKNGIDWNKTAETAEWLAEYCKDRMPDRASEYRKDAEFCRRMAGMTRQ